MGTIAVISDVHGNLEALEAVLARIDALKVDAIYSLGDVVGYGPDPEACLALVTRRCRVDRKSTRLNSSHRLTSRMPSSA
jgi:Icc-related predicted phosphoesterase